MSPTVFARLLTVISLIYGLIIACIFQSWQNTESITFTYSPIGYILWLLSVIVSSGWFYLLFWVKPKNIKQRIAILASLFFFIPASWCIAATIAMKLGFIDLVVPNIAGSINNNTLSLQLGFINGIAGVRPWLWFKSLNNKFVRNKK